MNTARGFTIIELLVVIAIIGILSSVVLASLSAARDKAADAAIKSNIGNMRAEAELYYDSNGSSYSGMCNSAVILASVTQTDLVNKTGSVTCVDGDDVSGRWAIEAQLVASSTAFYCTDNDGSSDIYTISTISTTGGSEDAVCGI